MILSWLPSAHAQQPCQAAFTYVVTNPNPTSYVINFYDSSWALGTITSWQWSFGNGTGSSAQNPIQTFTSPGYHYVCLTITSIYNGTSCTSVSCDSILVPGTGAFCTAMFSSVTNGNTVTFTNLSSGNYTNVSWSFGDGGTSTATNPSHTYSTAGTYQVCLTVLNNATGCLDTYCQNVTVSGGSGSCQASFTYTVTPSGVVQFTSTSTGGPTQFVWSFGDGSSGTGANPLHTYTSNGIYIVCLTVSNPGTTCQSTWCDSIYVGNTLSCTANFSWNATGNTVAFTNNSTNTGPNPDYYWTFGDGSTSFATNPSYTYTSAGTYQVCLMLIDSTTGCADMFCQNVTVTGGGSGCSSNYAIYPDSVMAHTYWAYNLATGTGNLTYLWSWGDGTSSTGAYPSHTYAGPGMYTICLTITDASGCNSTTCYQWSLLRLSGNAPVTINVIAGSTGINQALAPVSLNVFPNPASGALNVNLTNNTGEPASVELFNIEGQKVADMGSVSGQSVQLNADLQGIPAGMYFLRVAAGTWQEHLKVIIK
jgi:PKD repeat protein